MDNNHPREDEKRRREAAQAATADVEPGGTEVQPRSIKQMVSVRLEAKLLKELRLLASERGLSVSDLLREAAIGLIERSRPISVHVSVWSAGAPQVIRGEIITGRPVTSGIAMVNDAGQPPVSTGPKNVSVTSLGRGQGPDQAA
jgi:hypothetical protein